MTRRGKRRQFLPGSRKQLHTHGPWQPLSHPRTSSRLDYSLARDKSQPCPDTCYCQAECQPWVWLRGAQTSLSFLPNRWCLVNPQESPVSLVSAFRKCEKFGGPEEKVPQVGLAHSAPTVAQPPDYHHLQQLQSLKHSAPLPVAAPFQGTRNAVSTHPKASPDINSMLSSPLHYRRTTTLLFLLLPALATLPWACPEEPCSQVCRAGHRLAARSRGMGAGTPQGTQSRRQTD